MKKPMTIEEALELVIDEAMYSKGLHEYSTCHDWEKCKQAVDILRNMAEEIPVKKSEKTKCVKCKQCGNLFDRFNEYCTSCGVIPWPRRADRNTIKTWTETRVLKIVNEKTDVKFEKVKP